MIQKKGEIITIDIIPHNKRIYWNIIDDLKGPQTRQQLLEPYANYLNNINFLTGNSLDIIKQFKNTQFNFIFLDGNHDFYNVKKEYDLVKKNFKKKTTFYYLMM